MLPACAKTEVWKTLLDDLSNRIGAPIVCGTATFGKLPFFQELRNRLSDNPYSTILGVRYVSIPVDGMIVHVGPFLANESHALDEELADARQKLPPWDERYSDLIRLTIEHAAIAGRNAHTLSDSLNRAKLLLEFSHAAGHSRDLEHALYSTVQFVVHKFKISNMFISAYGKHARYFDLTEPAALAEQRVIAHLRDSKSTTIIQNAATDFLLHGIKDLDKIPPCIIGLPLLSQREPIGHALLSCDQMPNIEGISEVLYELVSVLSRLSEYAKVQHSAVTDALTGLNNRAELTKRTDDLLKDLVSRNEPISVLMIDADNFKRYNDTHGHLEGDKVLKVIGELIRSVTPTGALCCRYGGEEFILILPKADQHIALGIAEKLRRSIEETCPLTVSVGVITCMNSSASREVLIKHADDQMYRAKNLGKNRVTLCVMVDKNIGVIEV